MKFTIFTPIFNCRHTIHRVWNSIKSQSYRDFEWIIVDDGSTDNVYELLEEYKNRASFNVNIIVQKNMGKRFAWNKAVQAAQGVLFVPADADDEFAPNTLEIFNNTWENITDKRCFSGVNVLCKDPYTGLVVGDEFPVDGMTSNSLELFFKYKIRGEKWGCIRTDILRNNLFPEEIGGKGYFPESFIWFSIARNYNAICLNKVLRIYYPNNDGITSSAHKSLRKNAPTLYSYSLWHINTNSDYIFKYSSAIQIFKRYVRNWQYGLLANNSILSIIRSIAGKISRLFIILAAFPGILSYYYIKLNRDNK